MVLPVDNCKLPIDEKLNHRPSRDCVRSVLRVERAVVDLDRNLKRERGNGAGVSVVLAYASGYDAECSSISQA